MSETFAWLGYDITIAQGKTQWVGTADDGSRTAPFLFVAPTADEVKRAIRVFIRDRVPETDMEVER
jgi:NADPH-dependent ferric siderophore reductase